MSEDEWLCIFGDNLYDLLREKHISQRELADSCGVSEASISNYIRKRKIPTLKAIINISYALDISVEELIDFGDRIK